MFRGLARTANPFLNSAAQKENNRLLKTGVDTSMQIVRDVFNDGQSLRKAAAAPAKGNIDGYVQRFNATRGKRSWKKI